MNLLSWKEILADNWRGIKEEGLLFVCEKIAAILGILEQAKLIERQTDMQKTLSDMWWTRLGQMRFIKAVNELQGQGWTLLGSIEYEHGIFGLRMLGTATLVEPAKK